MWRSTSDQFLLLVSLILSKRLSSLQHSLKIVVDLFRRAIFLENPYFSIQLLNLILLKQLVANRPLGVAEYLIDLLGTIFHIFAHQLHVKLPCEL